jgi:cell shape-determining protein MreC
MISAAFFTNLFGQIWKILTFLIPVPVFALALIFIWGWFDKSSAVRRAVNQVVAGAEIDAANARAEAQARLKQMTQAALLEQAKRALAAEVANRQFADQLAKAESLNQELTDELDDLLSQPEPVACAVDPGLLDRLHNE